MNTPRNTAHRAAPSPQPGELSTVEPTGVPVISSMVDPVPAPSPFKDDGDMRLFSGSDDYLSGSGDGGLQLFKD